MHDNGIYDQFFKKDIENQVNDIIQKSEDITGCIHNVPQAIEEIDEVMRNLPNGKAPGFDGVTYEHLKYGSEIIVCALFEIVS